MAFEPGPYLTAAFLCEKVLIEQDGLKSAIRIFDRTTRTVGSPAPPKEMEPFDYEFTVFISFKAGAARGPMPLRITLVKPSGDSSPPSEQQLYFEGEDDRGVEVIAATRVKITMPGVYWFLIYLENTPVTRIPWRVIYSPIITPRTPA
jgi:hypothetical protein